MTLAQALANATGEIIPSDDPVGVRIVYNVTLENMQTEMVSVTITTTGTWEIAALEEYVRGELADNNLGLEWGQRYKIVAVAEGELLSIVQGGLTSPLLTLAGPV